MNDRPILFSAAMVRALGDGCKTQTRRVAKVAAIMGNRVPVYPPEELIELKRGEFRAGVMHYASSVGPLSGPYDIGFRVGDRLYVREDYYQRGHWEPVDGATTKGGKQKWAFIPADEVIRFDAPEEYRRGRHHADPGTVAWHKRLGRFMPRAASRITLIVTDVRVERLQDCSERDALAEGVIEYEATSEDPAEYAFAEGGMIYGDAKSAYAALWDSINGVGAWATNPWVVAVTFIPILRNIDARIGGAA